MTNVHRTMAQLIGLAVLLGGSVLADDVRELSWEELVPGGEIPQAPPIDHSGGMFTAPIYPTGVVDELDGIQAKLPGFIVPLELADEGKVKEFLLVPYFGACIHYPPPPPNQIVYVIMDEPVELDTPWAPIWAVGELTTEFRGSDLGSAGYTMMAQAIEEYEY